MRLFVAVELSSDALAVAADVSRALQRYVSTIAPRARLTWVPTGRMHLTLRFLGAVDDVTRDAVESVLAAPLETTVFTLTLGGAGAFPLRGAPRVVWLGIEQGLVDLQRLEREVSQRLASAGIPPDRQPFRAHLTLARVRDPQGLRLPAHLDGVVRPGHSAAHIDAITLFESRLSPKGPTYTPLRRTPLRPA